MNHASWMETGGRAVNIALLLYSGYTSGVHCCLPAVISDLQKLHLEDSGGRCYGASEALTSSALLGTCYERC